MNVLLPRYLIAFKNILRSIENIGMSVVDGINYYARGSLRHENYINYVRHDALGSDLLNSSLKFVPAVRRLFVELSSKQIFRDMQDR